MAFYMNVNMLGPFFTSLFSLCFGLTVLFFSKQSTPYMDEVFHIPQAQKYCEHKFDEWDEMITTLPGLYYCSWLLMEALAMILKQEVKTVCMPLFLRMTNVLFNIGNIWVVYRILRKLHAINKTKEMKTDTQQMTNNENEDSLNGNERFFLTSTALTIGIFPLLFFFMFLYYTDNGSTFFVLLMYYFSITDWHFCASIAGIYAVFFRQTNIVWVVFSAGVAAVRVLEPKIYEKLGAKSNEVFEVVLEFTRQVFSNMKSVVRVLWPYIMVVMLFGIFVKINGGVAVGDRTHHQVNFNFPQIFYFACFTVFFSFAHITSPTNLYKMYAFLTHLSHRRYHTMIILIVFIVYYFIQNYTVVHPYLLADNRHYPFYIWKNIYKAYPQAKIALIPVYLLATVAIFTAIDQSYLWKLVYALCVAVVLIPQGLLEFRYFIVPYIMFRIHMYKPQPWKLFSEFMIYASVNFFTIWVFLKKPFKWPGSTDTQRFMW